TNQLTAPRGTVAQAYSRGTAGAQLQGEWRILDRTASRQQPGVDLEVGHCTRAGIGRQADGGIDLHVLDRDLKVLARSGREDQPASLDLITVWPFHAELDRFGKRDLEDERGRDALIEAHRTRRGEGARLIGQLHGLERPLAEHHPGDDRLIGAGWVV